MQQLGEEYDMGRILVCVGVAFGVAGCGAAPVCTPGAGQACVGASNCAGSELCAAAGEGWGACECVGDAGATSDAGPDAGMDAGSSADAGVDAGLRDAGPPDAGLPDAGADAGLLDAGRADAGMADAGAHDAGVDAGRPDAGPGDASVDAGASDAAVDAGPAADAGVNPCVPGYYLAGGNCLDMREWSQWPTPPDSPPSSNYTTTSDTVTDLVTGLVWQRTASSGSYSLALAQAYCSGLALDGLSGWRVPTFIELTSILDFGLRSPALDTTVFAGTQSSFYGSATPDPGASTFRIVSFFDGQTNSGGNPFRPVRCVMNPTVPTGGGPRTRYVVTADTVFDSVTNLTWQRVVTTLPFRTQFYADQHCQDLLLAGQMGWRLPTMKDLLSIIDVSALHPAIDDIAFPNTMTDYFWSSRQGAGVLSTDTWVVNFDWGAALTSYSASSTGDARCVK
jgi:hypothetical protein